MKSAHHWITYSLALASLALVFVMYTRGDFMMDIANQVWACF
jgi:hypothetical protein